MVRGGFGMMYERIQGNDMYDAGPNIPFSLNVGLQSVTLDNPSISLATGTAASRPINPADITGLAVNNYKLPSSYQYSIGVQHSLNAKSVLSVYYVGNQNRHQSDRSEYNLPNASALPALIAALVAEVALGLDVVEVHRIRVGLVLVGGAMAEEDQVSALLQLLNQFLARERFLLLRSGLRYQHGQDQHTQAKDHSPWQLRRMHVRSPC